MTCEEAVGVVVLAGALVGSNLAENSTGRRIAPRLLRPIEELCGSATTEAGGGSDLRGQLGSMRYANTKRTAVYMSALPS